MQNIDQEQELLLQEIEDLEWNNQAKLCVEKCEQYLKIYPNCKRVIPYYAHMYHFIDYGRATDITKKLYDEQPFNFQNTYIYVYLLFDYDKRGREDIQKIYDSCKDYKGEKDINFYLAYSTTCKQLNRDGEELELLEEAIKKFPDDKMLARVYHHISASTGDDEMTQKSIELQPNYDYNFLHLGSFLGHQYSHFALECFDKALTINPLNYYAFLYKARFYNAQNQQEKAKENFNYFLSFQKFNPSHISQYLSWRIAQEQRNYSTKRENIDINLLKNAFLYEFLNKQNIKLFKDYIQNFDLFSENERVIDEARDLLIFYILNSVKGYLSITQNKNLSEFGKQLVKESNQNLQIIMLLTAYNKNLRNDMVFKQEYLLWDLFID